MSGATKADSTAIRGATKLPCPPPNGSKETSLRVKAGAAVEVVKELWQDETKSHPPTQVTGNFGSAANNILSPESSLHQKQLRLFQPVSGFQKGNRLFAVMRGAICESIEQDTSYDLPPG